MTTQKKFIRNGNKYTASFNDSKLVKLVNDTNGDNIPSDTKSFRRLADGNRGKKFQPA